MLQHRTAAIYLWGYAAEMTLKVAWFRLIGFPDTKPILSRDLADAVTQATKVYGIPWPPYGKYHAIWHWAQLLKTHRESLKGPYPDPRFAAALLSHSQRVYNNWREVLRYKQNQAYLFEAQTVRDSTQWLLQHRDQLAN